jgi:hypothetical protein
MAEDYPRIQARISDDAAQWLDGRAERMHTGSRHQQAAVELGLWRSALEIELGRIRLTLAQANCIMDVCNTGTVDAAVGSRPGLVYASCYDAFQIAREAPIPDLSSYGAEWGPDGCDSAQWEQDLLDYLGTLNAVADHALRDAIARWWSLPDEEPLPDDASEEEKAEAQIAQFASVGLRIWRKAAQANSRDGDR